MSEQSLVIVPPVNVTDAMLLATDVPEADYAAWNGATAYTVAQRVIRVTTNFHKIYERVVAGTTATAPEADATNWIEVSPTNRWKLLDRRNSSRTAQANGFYYRLLPGATITAIHVGDVVDCSAVRARLIDPVFGTVYDTTVSMAGVPMTSDWHSFMVGAWTGGQKFLTLADLPSFPNAELRVDFTGGANLAVGVLMIGQGYEFGLGVRFGVRAGIKDYSQKEANKFGDVDFVEGPYSKTVRFTLRLRNEQIDTVHDFLADLRAQPALYIVYGPITATHVFGRYLNFETVIPYATNSDCELQLEGLT